MDYQACCWGLLHPSCSSCRVHRTGSVSGLQPSENCRWRNRCAINPSLWVVHCTILSKSHSGPTLLLLGVGKSDVLSGSLHHTLFSSPPLTSPAFLTCALAGTSPRYQHSSARLSRGGPFNSAQTDNIPSQSLLPPRITVSVLRWHRALRTCTSHSGTVIDGGVPTSCHWRSTFSI